MRIRRSVAIAGSVALASSILFAASDIKEFHRTLPFEAEGRVTIDTYKGTIRVTTWDRNEVDITARIEPDEGWFARSAKHAEVQVDGSGKQVRVRSESGAPPFSFLGGSVPFFHYTIQVPRTANLRIKDYKSESDIAGLEGDLDVDTYKGSVRVTGLSGALTLNTYKGDARVQFASFDMRSSVETYKGDIELRMPRNTRFDLNNLLDRRADFHSDFRMNGEAAGPSLRVKSHKGSVRLIAQ